MRDATRHRWRWALDGSPRPWTVTVGLVVLLGTGDELLQSTVPGRDPSGLDLVVDVAAAGVAATTVGRWVRTTARPRRR